VPSRRVSFVKCGANLPARGNVSAELKDNEGLGNWDLGFIDPGYAKLDSGWVMEERRKDRSGNGERRKADAERIVDELKKRGRTEIHVRGTSMLPLVRPGDVALIRRDKLENMRSGDVVLMQRGDHLVAKRIGELEDSGGAGISGEEMVDSGADSQDVSGQNARQQWLGKIVRVRRKKEKIELGAKKTPAETLASVVLRPARWVKEKVRDTEEADREAQEIKR
jgi:Peptidase S24-like